MGKIESERFRSDLFSYDVTSYADVKERSTYVQVINFCAVDRGLGESPESNEFANLENELVKILLSIKEEHELFELVFPPVSVHRKMKRPGVYKFDDFRLCISDGLRDIEHFQFYIPSLKLLFENGHNLYFTVYYDKEYPPVMGAVDYLIRIIESSTNFQIDY